MIRKLDQRGVAALEFCLVAVPFFTLMFAIFDFGQYAITVQSLRTLANAGARAMMVQRGDLVDAEYNPISCYAYLVKYKNLPTVCTAPLSDVQVAQDAAALTVTASKPEFSMLMPIWGTAFNKVQFFGCSLDAPKGATCTTSILF